MAEKQLPSIVHNHFHEVKLFKKQELGHGSFATVYRAQCDDLPCAAKVLHAKFFDQQDPDPGEQTLISKFVEECKILPSITHPNIVQCFGMYQDPDTNLPVLLMELMDESLTDYIERFCDPAPYHIQISFSYDISPTFTPEGTFIEICQATTCLSWLVYVPRSPILEHAVP